MTDDEIDAAIRTLCNLPSFREVTAARTVERDRAIFRAGMREAAKIAAEEQKQKQYTDWDAGRKCGIEICITAIERAAGGEG